MSVVAIVAVIVAANTTVLLPPELAGLSALAGDERQLVDAVRAYDLQQGRLRAWDLEMAAELGRDGEGKLAAMKRGQAAQRNAHVRQAYEYVLTVYPASARAANYFGELLYDELGDEAEGLRLWRRAVASDPTLSAPYNNLGIHYCHVGEYARGLEAYLEAVKLEPDNPGYLFNLAQAYLVHAPQMQRLQRWDAPRLYKEAVSLSARAAAADPGDFTLVRDYALNFFAGESLGVAVDWAGAAKVWQRARGLAPSTNLEIETWLYEARAWLRNASLDKAEACLDEVLALRAGSVAGQSLLGKVRAARAGATHEREK